MLGIIDSFAPPSRKHNLDISHREVTGGTWKEKKKRKYCQYPDPNRTVTSCVDSHEITIHQRRQSHTNALFIKRDMRWGLERKDAGNPFQTFSVRLPGRCDPGTTQKSAVHVGNIPVLVIAHPQQMMICRDKSRVSNEWKFHYLPTYLPTTAIKMVFSFIFMLPAEYLHFDTGKELDENLLYECVNLRHFETSYEESARVKAQFFFEGLSISGVGTGQIMGTEVSVDRNSRCHSNHLPVSR
ncbi:hypothetical protein B0H14DRAFT_2562211 [Mycena olivaceomarginata]|nr:hypothetical protein B0H14DRAFT_2562211 [Mycena olivaceomarginata]